MERGERWEDEGKEGGGVGRGREGEEKEGISRETAECAAAAVVAAFEMGEG